MRRGGRAGLDGGPGGACDDLELEWERILANAQAQVWRVSILPNSIE
jgi:hypothetical protein